MNIIWKYVDKRAAAVAALKDYDAMKFIIENSGEEIRGNYESLAGVRGISYDGMPKSHNPNAGEDRILNGLETIDILRERYRQATEFMKWFQPAWEKLTEEERMVLDTFYSETNAYGNSAADHIARYFGIEQTSAYKKKNRALDRLTMLLFGKE